MRSSMAQNKEKDVKEVKCPKGGKLSKDNKMFNLPHIKLFLTVNYTKTQFHKMK